MQSHLLARKTTHIGGVFPRGFLIDGIAEQLIRVGERKAGDRLAGGVLQFDSEVAGRGRGVVQGKASAGELQRLRRQFAAGQRRVQGNVAIKPNRVAS